MQFFGAPSTVQARGNRVGWVTRPRLEIQSEQGCATLEEVVVVGSGGWCQPDGAWVSDYDGFLPRTPDARGQESAVGVELE